MIWCAANQVFATWCFDCLYVYFQWVSIRNGRCHPIDCHFLQTINTHSLVVLPEWSSFLKVAAFSIVLCVAPGAKQTAWSLFWHHQKAWLYVCFLQGLNFHKIELLLPWLYKYSLYVYVKCTCISPRNNFLESEWGILFLDLFWINPSCAESNNIQCRSGLKKKRVFYLTLWQQNWLCGGNGPTAEIVRVLFLPISLLQPVPLFCWVWCWLGIGIPREDS